MQITKTLYVADRHHWRSWLKENYNKEPEIWLIYYKKGSGKERISYNDAVEEALCFGWIDSIVKGIDSEKYAQRFSPRKPTSVLSPMNKERIIQLIKKRLMTKAGLDAVAHVFDSSEALTKLVIPPDTMTAFKANKLAWANFQKFPLKYQRIRICFVEGARDRPAEFKKRLNYLIHMTEQGKQFGFGGIEKYFD